MTPCIHGDGHTLCPACQEQYDADPTAWEEYGHHPEGERRWAEALAEINTAMLARASRPVVDDSDRPL